jgi:hypothetical protein
MWSHFARLVTHSDGCRGDTAPTRRARHLPGLWWLSICTGARLVSIYQHAGEQLRWCREALEWRTASLAGPPGKILTLLSFGISAVGKVRIFWLGEWAIMRDWKDLFQVFFLYWRLGHSHTWFFCSVYRFVPVRSVKHCMRSNKDIINKKVRTSGRGIFQCTIWTTFWRNWRLPRNILSVCDTLHTKTRTSDFLNKKHSP